MSLFRFGANGWIAPADASLRRSKEPTKQIEIAIAKRVTIGI